MIFTLIRAALTLLEFAIIARAVLSWIPNPPDNQLVRLLYQITEPILSAIRRLLDKYKIAQGMMFDLSPVIALLLIIVLQSIFR